MNLSSLPSANPERQRPKVSVVICTRDRVRSLERTLEIFSAQKFSGEYAYEVIVVDNGSSDGTEAFVRRWIEKYPDHVRYIAEPRKGLTFARNAGIESAVGEIIVFTDDDVLVDSEWLNEIYHEFGSDPELLVLGGRVLPGSDDLQRVSLQVSQERRTFVFPDPGFFLMGANMAFRREIFDRIGRFDVRLGAGRFFAGADEAEIFYRALRSGCRLLYAPTVTVYHNHDRKSVDQAVRLEYGYAKGFSAYLMKHAMRGDRYAMRVLYWTFLKVPKRWSRRNADSEDLLRRRRGQVYGLIVGLLAAPWVMWRRDGY